MLLCKYSISPRKCGLKNLTLIIIMTSPYVATTNPLEIAISAIDPL